MSIKEVQLMHKKNSVKSFPFHGRLILCKSTRKFAMPVAKPGCRTMWMVPRNIRYIEPWKLMQIMTLLKSFDGNAADQSLQDAIYEELAALGVKCTQREYGVSNPGGLRTYLAQLACLGLVWRDPQTKCYQPTRAGEQLMTSDNPRRVVVCQLLRMQYPSVYGLGTQVGMDPGVKVKPFAFLLDLLEEPLLEGRLADDEIAVAVIYGRTEQCRQKVVDKILEMRQGRELGDVVDALEDICTPRRWNLPDAVLHENGIVDAVNIGNTFKNYMLAAGLIEPLPKDSGFGRSVRCYGLRADQALADEIAAWRAESLEPAPVSAADVRWQCRFGRYDQHKSSPKSSRAKVDGFVQLMSSSYLRAAAENPFGFSHDVFVSEQARKWGRTQAEVEQAVRAVRPKTHSVFRDVLTSAAQSGGRESITLELGVANLFVKMGFDKSFQSGQKKAPAGRAGGYPDVWVQSSSEAECGWAEAKATTRYGFPIGDRNKLNTYYRNCSEEIDPASPCSFFVFVAGGFLGSRTTLEQTLIECSRRFGRPVSALTVETLMDLAERNPDPAALLRAFRRGLCCASAGEILCFGDD